MNHLVRWGAIFFAPHPTPAFIYSAALSEDTGSIWVFPKIGVPQNGWFIMENRIKMDDLGVTPIFGNIHMYSMMLHAETKLVILWTYKRLQVQIMVPINKSKIHSLKLT